MLRYHPVYIAGWSSPVARWAHNPKVAGSNPAPATPKKGARAAAPFFFFSAQSSRFRTRADPRPLLSIAEALSMLVARGGHNVELSEQTIALRDKVDLEAL
jgi:hypothetical protein